MLRLSSVQTKACRHAKQVSVHICRRAMRPSSALFRQWAGAKLKPDDLARRALAGFHVKRRTGADGRPERAAFPAAVGIVNPAVEPLRVEAERIGDAQDEPGPIFQNEQSFLCAP